MAERLTPLVKKNGVVVGRGQTIDFREGSNITMTVETTDHETDVTIAASGSGGIATVKEANASVVTSATSIDFGSGFDIADEGSGEAGVSLDLSEAAGGGDLSWSTNTPTIPNDTVTYAKMQNVSAASRLLGRGSAAGAGDVQELTVGAGLTLSGTELSSAASAPTYMSIIKWVHRG